MSSRILTNTNEEVTRIAGGVSPPVVEQLFLGKTRITGPWSHEPYAMDVLPMQEHVIAATHSGHGTATAIMGHRRTTATIRGGTCNILVRGHFGRWELTGGSTVSNVYLGHDRLTGFADQLAEGRTFELVDSVQGECGRLFAIMRLICDEATSPGPRGSMYIEHALDLLCFELLRSHSTLWSFTSQRQRGLPAAQVKRVIAYMHERLGMDMSLEEIAAVAHMSRYHFCVAFKKSTGLTPFECLTRMRMKTAHDLLSNSSLSIAEIGLAVGYASGAAFSTAFRRLCGSSPRAYRSQL